MKIQTAPLVQGSLARTVARTVARSVEQHPFQYIADVVDLSTAPLTALSALSDQGAQAVQTASGVMGAFHACKSIYHLARAGQFHQQGYGAETRHEMVLMTGEALCGVGQACAASGVGPVSLGFLGVGMLVTNLATLTA